MSFKQFIDNFTGGSDTVADQHKLKVHVESFWVQKIIFQKH